MTKSKDFVEEVNEWYETKNLYTTKELLDWIRSYGRQITILADIIEERCKKEGYLIDIIKEEQ